MRLVLIYEILFHRPSENQRYLFQALRAVSPHELVLTAEQITELKRLIVCKFINPYISDDQYKLETDVSDQQRLDALLTLSTIPVRRDAEQQAHPTSPAS